MKRVVAFRIEVEKKNRLDLFLAIHRIGLQHLLEGCIDFMLAPAPNAKDSIVQQSLLVRAASLCTGVLPDCVTEGNLRRENRVQKNTRV